MFIHKEPCIVPHLLDEALCPPEGLHDPVNYPLYYDLLYHPRDHLSIFETPKNFIDWLAKSLKSHHLDCINCGIEFVGCIIFIDSSLKIVHGPSCMCLTKGPEYFAAARYTHCSLLRDLKGLVDSPSTVAACVEQQMVELPCWLRYSESIYEHNLSRLKVDTLALSVSKLSLGQGKRQKKKGLVTALCAHFQQACSSLEGRSAAEVIDEYSDIELPIGCARNPLPLLSEHFRIWYGSDVAAALCQPPEPVYAFTEDVTRNRDHCNIEWASLPQDDLVNRLHYFSTIVSTNLIFQGLPATGKVVAPKLSRAEFAKSVGTLSPSKAKAVATRAVATTSTSAATSGSGVIRISDLPDPQGRYAGLLRAHTELADARVVAPDILDSQGIQIVPASYDPKFGDDQFVEVEVYLKFWNIAGGVSNGPGSRVYQLVLKSMKLLPYHSYTKEAMLNATVATKKRKARSDEGDAESSERQGSKKKIVTAGPNDEMEGVEL